MTKRRILAGDVGGSHITVALFEEIENKLRLVRTVRTPVDSKLEKDRILNEWLSVYKQFDTPSFQPFYSLAMPAPFDYSNGVCWIKEQNKFNSLFGVNIKQELSDRLKVPADHIQFINDAEAFLYGESLFGVGKGIDNILGLTLGSGLGSALKIDGKVWDASLWSYPFYDSIAEDFLGTGWFIRWAKEAYGLELPGVKELVTHPFLQHDLQKLFDLYAYNLAEFIFQQYLVYQFQKVVIGGNIVQSKDYFLSPLKQYLLQRGLGIPIAISQLGEQSALFGAASLYYKGETLF